MNWSELIGKTVAAFRGLKWKKTKVPLSHILFDDEETMLILEEQSYHDFHDCDHSARTLRLYKDKKLWKEMFDKGKFYEEPNNIKVDPF